MKNVSLKWCLFPSHWAKNPKCIPPFSLRAEK